MPANLREEKFTMRLVGWRFQLGGTHAQTGSLPHAPPKPPGPAASMPWRVQGEGPGEGTTTAPPTGKTL